MCIDHDFPSRPKELKMLEKYVDYHNIVLDDPKFLDNLCQFAEVTRKSYKDEAIDEQVSTRRLFHVLNIYAVLGDKMKSINFAIARFDTEIKDAFLSLYKKIDENVIDPNHQPVNLSDGIHVSLTDIVTQVISVNKNELQNKGSSPLDFTLTSEFVAENASVLIPNSKQVYELESDEYKEVSNQVLTLLQHGIEKGTSTLDPSILSVDDAVNVYQQKVDELKNIHFTSTQVEDSHGHSSTDSNTPEFQLDKLLSPNTYEQFQSIEDYLAKKGES